MKRITIFLVLVALTLGVAPAQAQSEQRFEPIECPMPIPAGVRVTCGEYQVPENRSQPQSRMISDAVCDFAQPESQSAA